MSTIRYKNAEFAIHHAEGSEDGCTLCYFSRSNIPQEMRNACNRLDCEGNEYYERVGLADDSGTSIKVIIDLQKQPLEKRRCSICGRELSRPVCVVCREHPEQMERIAVEAQEEMALYWHEILAERKHLKALESLYEGAKARYEQAYHNSARVKKLKPAGMPRTEKKKKVMTFEDAAKLQPDALDALIKQLMESAKTPTTDVN